MSLFMNKLLCLSLVRLIVKPKICLSLACLLKNQTKTNLLSSQSRAIQKQLGSVTTLPILFPFFVAIFFSPWFCL